MDNTAIKPITTNYPVSSLDKIDLSTNAGLAVAENVFKRIMQSSKGGIKTIEDGIAILLKAQSLKIPFAAAAENIHVVNGRTGISVHIVRAILLRAEVTWVKTQDYAPQYNYTDGSITYTNDTIPSYAQKCRNAEAAENLAKDNILGVYPMSYYQDFKGATYTELQLGSNCVVVKNKVEANQASSEGKYPVFRIPTPVIDYTTEYKFTRIINGKEVTAVGKFSYSDSVRAGLADKDVWKHYPNIMCANRAFTIGAREIASDLLLGYYSDAEVNEIENKEIPVEDVEAYTVD